MAQSRFTTVRYSGDDDDGGAEAPTTATASSSFTIQVKGGDAKSNRFKPIKTLKNEKIAVRVYSQASGGGNAMADVSDNKDPEDVGAGDTDREVTVIYTAGGEINSGSLKLAIPAGWSNPLMSNVDISSTGSVGSSSASDFGGYYVGNPDDETDDKEVPKGGPGAMEVLVDGVSLDEGETVTFVYSAATVQAVIGDPKFTVAVDGGAGPGEGTADVTPDPADATTISVGDASPGSGTGRVEVDAAVTVNSVGKYPDLHLHPGWRRLRIGRSISVSKFPEVGRRRPTRSETPKRELSPLRRRSSMVSYLNRLPPLSKLSKQSVRLIGRWLPVSNLIKRCKPVTRLSSLTRMLTLLRRLEPPLSLCFMEQMRSRMPT